PGGELRVAVQGEDRGHVGERAVFDHGGGAGGELLLRGLEDQPEAAGQVAAGREFGEDVSEADEDRGVRVVAAGVADAVDGGAVGDVLGVLDGQGVHVGADGDDPVAFTDVAGQAGAVGDEAWFEADGGEPGGDVGRGVLLVPGQARVRVDVAAVGDEVVEVGPEPGVEEFRERGGHGGRLRCGGTSLRAEGVQRSGYQEARLGRLRAGQLGLIGFGGCSHFDDILRSERVHFFAPLNSHQ